MRTKIIIILLCNIALVTAQNVVPRAEYPRPQFERSNWVNLNGEWSYTFDFVGSGFERDYPAKENFAGKIIVPFPPESKLSGVEYKDFINHIWYQRKITIPEGWSGKNILLNFGAVYYLSEIYIDGKFAGRHLGGSSSFSVDITKLATPGNTHNLVVYASSDVRSTVQTAGKQSPQYASSGGNYTRTTGIWQTVWMEAVAPQGLKSAHIITDIDQKQMIIHPQFYKEGSHLLRIDLLENGKTIASQTVKASNSSVVVLPVKNVKMWNPESPFLYDIVYRVTDAKNNVLDEVTSYAGMRKIHTEENKIYLNNQPYYQRLVLDQGFYPDGIWTAPSDEALQRDILLSKEAGFNGARLHQKVFEERFHYWADRLGYITWGEAPSWGMDANNIEAARNFIIEWTDIVLRDRNHPSLLIWTPLNEHRYIDKIHYPLLMEYLYDLTKNLDPTRPFNGCDGGTHIKTDIWSIHIYSQNPDDIMKRAYRDDNVVEGLKIPKINSGGIDLKDNAQYVFPVYDGSMTYMISEFGGIKWAKDPELQMINDWNHSFGYGNPSTIEEFYTLLESQVDIILSLKDRSWGYCYTQLTDVEQEQNGVYYYDRSSKFDMKRIHAIFSKNPGK